jgi:hypothetical protein
LTLTDLIHEQQHFKGGFLMIDKNEVTSKRSISKIEYVGLALVALSLIGLLFSSDSVAGFFDKMVENSYVVFQVFIFGTWSNGVYEPSTVGLAVIVSVIVGRILERLGFTDALIRIFTPVMKYIGVNSTVVIPAIYNILGDINAAGRIAGPVLISAGATKDEQKIAVATMVQSQQSFATFMLGLLVMSMVGIRVFPVILITQFLPLILVPLILRLTIYRNTKSVPFSELPKFTPDTPIMGTLFGSAREGAELLFLLIIPAAVVVYSVIGGLDFLGIWAPINQGISKLLSFFSIDPESGMLSVLVSPTLAMAILKTTLEANPEAVSKAMVLGSVVLGASGFPLSVIFGQIPSTWADCTELTEREAMGAAVLGSIMRILTAALMAGVLGFMFF